MKMLLVAALMLLAFGGAAFSGETKPVIYVGGGINPPISPHEFTGYWDPGFSLGGGLGASLSENIEIVGSVYYCSHQPDHGAYEQRLRNEIGVDVQLSGGALKLLEMMISMKVAIPAVSPGGLAVLGLLLMAAGALRRGRCRRPSTGG